MRQRYPQTQYVVQTEEGSICATKEQYGEHDWRLVYVIDELLKLTYFHGALEPVNTDRGGFQIYCVGNYSQAPYTLLNAYNLWRRAYYLESAILLRHLLEVFVQMRYFERHPDLLQRHWTAQTRRDRIPFRTMFDELAPDSYHLIYGQFLSTFAHGNFNLGFRAQFSAPTPTQPTPLFQPIIGCQFDDQKASLNHFFWVSIVIGLMNYHPIFFPNHTVSTDRELSLDLMDTQDWLRTYFDHRRGTVQSTVLFDHMDTLMCV